MSKNLRYQSISLGSIVLDLDNLPTLTSPLQLTRGVDGRFAIDWIVLNSGDEDIIGSGYGIGSHEDGVYISTDEVLDARDIYNGFAIDRATAGGTYSNSQTLYYANNSQPETFYLIFKTDSTDRHVETDETDNTIVIPVTIPALPDFSISAANSPSSASQGNNFTVSWTVENLNDVAVPASWYDVVYVSNDEILDSSDTEVYYHYNNGITGLGNYSSGDITVNLGSNISGGSRYLLFATDAYGYIGESNENNNVIAKPIEIAAPDLIVTSATIPANWVLGESISLTATIANRGTVATTSGDWYDSVVISKDNVYGNEDDITAFDRSSYKSSIAPDGTYQNNFPFSPSSDLDTGNYYAFFVADRYNYQGETNENNNAFALGQISIDAPDLVISNATAPATAAASEKIDVSWTVKNQGSVSASGEWYDDIYLSTNDTYSDDDIYLTRRSAGIQTPLAAAASYIASQNITLPSQITAGNYYLVFRADGNNDRSETDNTNNDRAVGISIGLPDLVPTNLTAPTSGVLGQTINISWTVANQGNVDALADWRDYVYWSRDNVWDSSDTLLTSISAAAQTPIAAGSSYTKSQDVTIPSNVSPPGDGYLILRANGNNAQGEINNNNNDIATAFRLDAPDLTVTSVNAMASATAGSFINVSWVVKNQGTVTANADYLYDSVYISDDNVYDASDIFVGYSWQSDNTPLAADRTYRATSSVYIPDNIATGSRHLIVVADNYTNRDYSNRQVETNENNNYYAVPIDIVEIEILKPDLAVTSVTAPASAVLSDTIEVSWTVTNQGAASANSNWYDYIYLSEDQTLSANDTIVPYEGNAAQTNLAAGGSYTITKNITLPKSLSVGNRYLIFATDLNNSQVESNDNNNTRVVPIAFSAPDLVVTNFSAPANGTIGKPVDVSWTVKNQGTVSAPADWGDRIYFSTDATFDSRDILVVQELVNTQTPLAASGEYTVNRSINLPNVANQSGYLIVVADASGNQGETNNNNNASSAVAIALQAPDLVVGSITAPIESLSGKTVQIDWTVNNQGNAAAEGTWYDRLYLINANTNAYVRDLGTFAFSGSIAAGGSIDRTELISLPLDLSGDYKVVVRTDVSGHVAEGTNESNNTLTDDRTFAVRLAPVPNLRVTSVTPPPSALSSEETIVSWTVTNSGTGTTNAPTWVDKVYLSRDRILDNTDIYVGEDRQGEVDKPRDLKAGDSYTKSTLVTLPGGISGDYYFLVQTDADGRVTEVGNEGDNITASTATTPITIAPPIDLTVSAANSPIAAKQGDNIAVSWTVENLQDFALSGRWRDAVYISNDNRLDNSDTKIYERDNNRIGKLGSYSSGDITVNLGSNIVGSRYLLFATDTNNSVSESNENNNVIAKPIEIAGSDLTVTSVTTSTNNWVLGERISINATIANQGMLATPASSWRNSVVISVDNVYGNEDDITVFTQDKHHPSIASSGTYQNNFSFWHPNNVYQGNNTALPFFGNYFTYAFFVTDLNRDLVETNENNNAFSLGRISIDAPDLVMTDAIAPATGIVSETIDVSWTVKNQGNVRASSDLYRGWYDDIYLSTNNTYSYDDIHIASHWVDTQTPLAADTSYTASQNITLPSHITAGNYYLVFQSDARNYQGETNDSSNYRNNNDRAVAISIGVPDLVPTDLIAPTSAALGETVNISWTVKNQGNVAAPADWNDSVYWSRDNVWDSSDTLITSISAAEQTPIAADGSYTKSQNITIPNKISFPGDGYLILRADDNNKQGETNNNNNDITTAFYLDAPDLTVTSVNASTSPGLNSYVNVSWVVKNQGTVAANADYWSDSIYISNDNVFDRSDTFAGSRSVINNTPLAANGTYTANKSVYIPNNPNSRYLIVVTDNYDYGYGDYGNEQGEIHESNNYYVVPIDASGTDLVVTAATAPTSAVVGDTVEVSWTVANQGSGSANSDWYDYVYLSEDQTLSSSDITLTYESTATRTPLSAGSYTITKNVTLPTFSTGDRYLIFAADPNNYQGETNDNNNTRVVPISLRTSNLDDLPVITVVANDDNAGEVDNPGQFTISRDGITTQALIVNYSVSGNATGGTDYETLSGSVTFQAGESTKTIDLNTIDDNLYEGNETVTLKLTPVDGSYNIASVSEATVTIVDDDLPVITIVANDDNAGEASNPGQFTISRDGITTQALTVNYSISGNATSGTDYETLSGSITFNAGESVKTIDLTTIEDNLYEGDETITLKLTPVDGSYKLTSVSEATVTIVDNDSKPTISVTNVSRVSEGNSGATDYEFTITLSNPSFEMVTVNYTTADGTATIADNDYAAASDTLTFNPGDTSQVVKVNVNSDLIYEANETFNLNLSDATNATIVTSTAIGTIFNDDIQGLILIGNNSANTLTGGEGDDSIDGLGGNDILSGNGGSDSLIGGFGNDSLDGGTGSDNMAGGTGNDTYFVDSNGDIVTEEPSQGTDTVNATIDYTLTANVENLILTGNATSGSGNSLNNTITGNDGDNTLDGKEGNDRLIGGLGNDTYYVDSTGDVIVENTDAGNDTVIASVNYSLRNYGNVENLTLAGTATTATGNAANNTLTGNDLDNTLNGREGDDTLIGNGGNDVLDGGTGSDNMTGGSGDDTYYVDNIGDVVTEDANGGTDIVNASIDYTLGDNVENLTLTGGGSISGTGNSGDNVITGNNGSNTLLGKGGNDTIVGNRGSDILDGGEGDDTMEGNAGNDTYFVDSTGDLVIELVNAGNDTVKSVINYTLTANVENLILQNTALLGTGNELNNVITGNDENNTLLGEGGNDTLIGNGGNDVLDGGSGNDNMTGGTGDDTYYVDSLGDRVNEAANEGMDLVIATVDYSIAGNNYLNVENITLMGNAIFATGNILSNILTGNAQNNTLDGRAGADTMIGGLGNDTYAVDDSGDIVIENAGEGIDTVNASVNYTLAANVENLNLTGTADNGVGNDLDNTIVGNYRANRLDGGIGSDTLIGGNGNDTYVINSSGDVVIELAGGGTDTIESSIDYTLTDNVENLVLTATAINGTGNSGNNIITGNDANNTLIGGLGNDTYIGGLGNDTFVLNNPRQGVDIIKDFVSGSDVISIAAGGYGGGLTAGVALDSSQLRVGAGVTSANTASQRFILNTNNGNLYFDADGRGGNGAIQIAKLEGITTLSTSDFQIS